MGKQPPDGDDILIPVRITGNNEFDFITIFMLGYRAREAGLTMMEGLEQVSECLTDDVVSDLKKAEEKMVEALEKRSSCVE